MATNPTLSHEFRRRLLESVADLAGFRIEYRLQDGIRPDVLRLHASRLGMFVGEAKHTESPSHSRSTDRLRVYLDHLLSLSCYEMGSILAIAHPFGLALPWQTHLEWLCEDVSVSGMLSSKRLTLATTVTFVAFKVS